MSHYTGGFFRKTWVKYAIGFVAAIAVFGFILPMLWPKKDESDMAAGAGAAAGGASTGSTGSTSGATSGLARFWAGPVRY